MGGGSQTTTQSQKSQNTLPSWLLQPYQSSLGTAQGLAGSGLAATGAGPSMLGAGMSQIASVNPTAIGGANNALTNELGGGFLGAGASQMGQASPMIGAEASGALMNPATNPYLQQSYNLGLQGIQNNVDSQFGASGRNVLASAPVQADQASNLASNLFGGAYNTNLAAMQNAQGLASNNFNAGVGQINSAAGLAPGVTQGLYTPGQQMLAAGQTPFNLQSWYQGLLGQSAAPFGMSSGSGTSTVQNNPSLLSSIMGGIGTLAGAAGGILGAL